MGLTDEETVEQIRSNAYLPFFLGFACYSSNAPFDPSMMVYLRKGFSEEDLSHINELIDAPAVAASKDEAPAAGQAAITNIAAVTPFSGGGGLIQTTSG